MVKEFDTIHCLDEIDWDGIDLDGIDLAGIDSVDLGLKTLIDFVVGSVVGCSSEHCSLELVLKKNYYFLYYQPKYSWIYLEL